MVYPMQGGQGGHHGQPPPPPMGHRPQGHPGMDPRIVAVDPGPKKSSKKKVPKSSGGFLGFMAGKPPSKTKKSSRK
ncbi:hypothetical protein PG987_007629 [Apiospora arundinis]